MPFNKSLVAVVGLLSLTLASPAPEPQTPAQTSEFLSAIVATADALVTNTAFLAVFESIATDPAAVASLQAAAASLEALGEAHETPAPSFISALPTALQPIFESLLAEEESIGSVYGFTAGAEVVATDYSQLSVSAVATATSATITSAAATQTGNYPSGSSSGMPYSTVSIISNRSSSTSIGAPTSTMSDNGAAATVVGLAAAGLAGFMGVVMAL